MIICLKEIRSETVMSIEKINQDIIIPFEQEDCVDLIEIATF
jgi:hypothetical protein